MAKEEKKKVQPIARAEVRTYIQIPACPRCQEKNIGVFLQAREGLIEAISVANMDPQKMQVWSCPRCDFTTQLPPGAFPNIEYEHLMLEPIKVMAPERDTN